MFSGIVRGFYKISDLKVKEGLHSISIVLDEDLVSKLENGASVAVDGVCLTVTNIDSNVITLDVMSETLRVTTLRDLRSNDLVNIELSLTAQRDISGHIVSGHVDSTVLIDEIIKPDQNNCTIVFSVKEQWLKYIFPKGFISLNGCSLTVGWVDKEKGRFSVYLIPETLRRTTFSIKKIGDFVNMEVERQTQVIVDTIASHMEQLEAKLLNKALSK